MEHETKYRALRSKVTLCDRSGGHTREAVAAPGPPAPRPWPQGFKELLREFLERWKFKLPGKVNMSL